MREADAAMSSIKASTQPFPAIPAADVEAHHRGPWPKDERVEQPASGFQYSTLDAKSLYVSVS